MIKKSWKDLETDALGLIANEVYKKRVDNGSDLLDIIDEEYNQEFENKDETEMSEVRIKNWNVADMEKLCPGLYEKYWGKPMPSRYGRN